MANVTDLQRGLGNEDARIFAELEAAGWTIRLESFKYVWRNDETNDMLDPIDDDEEAIRAARVLHEGLPKKPAVIADPAAEGKSHTQLDHEVDLRAQVIKHLIEQGYQPESDVSCKSGIADVVTPDAIYEINCGLNEDTLRDVAYKLNGYCVDINPEADAVIITCCAVEIDELKESEQELKVHIETLEEFVSPPPQLLVEGSEQPTGESLFASSEPPALILSQQIHPLKIRTDPRTLMRAEGLNEDHVDDLREVLKRGGEFKDPVDVYYDGQLYHLADGNHRHAAALAENKLLDVNVHKGTLRDAILHAVRSNIHPGLKRSNDSKRLAVVTLLSDPEWFKLSDTQLAELAVVTQQFVSSVRRDLAELVPAMQSEAEDSQLADQLDISPGLVRVVRHRLPQGEAEQLSQNVLGDDGLRLGSDGVKRALPKRAEVITAPLFDSSTTEPGEEQRTNVLSTLEFTQRARWAKLNQYGAASDGGVKPVSEQELLDYKILEQEYENAWEQAVETLGGDTDAVQEVRDRIEAPEVFNAPASSQGAIEAESSPQEEAEPQITPSTGLKTLDDLKDVLSGAARSGGRLSRLQLEELGFSGALINSAVADGEITQPETGMFSLPKYPGKPANAGEPSEKKPSIEELLKGRPFSVSFVFIPGVKGKVNVTVNTGGGPEDATRKLIDSVHVRGFSEPVMQLIFEHLKKKPKSAKSQKKGAAKKGAAKKAVAKKSGGKKPGAASKKTRARA